MLFTASVAALVGAAAILAAPQPIIDLGNGVKLTPRDPRAVERATNIRKSLPKITNLDAVETIGNKSDVSYSTNWAGAVLIGTGYKSITGTIVVPTPSVPSGGGSLNQYAASAWVGIDGDTCLTAILQTGVDFYADRGGVSFDAWYEWHPGKSTTPRVFLCKKETIVLTVIAQTTPMTSPELPSRLVTPSP